jgi:hypothetical protein
MPAKNISLDFSIIVCIIFFAWLASDPDLEAGVVPGKALPGEGARRRFSATAGQGFGHSLFGPVTSGIVARMKWR